VNGREVKSEISPQRMTGPVEVQMDVPEGGFAGLGTASGSALWNRQEANWSDRSTSGWCSLWTSVRTPENA